MTKKQALSPVAPARDPQPSSGWLSVGNTSIGGIPMIPPLVYKTDCSSAGTFGLLGGQAKPMPQDGIEVCVFHASRLYGSLGQNRDRIDWLGLYFLAAPNEVGIAVSVPCYLLIKTGSLTNFMQVTYEVMSKGLDPRHGIYRMAMLPRQHSETIYHVLSFSWRQRQKSEEAALTGYLEFLEGVDLNVVKDPVSTNLLTCLDGMSREEAQRVRDGEVLVDSEADLRF